MCLPPELLVHEVAVARSMARAGVRVWRSDLRLASRERSVLAGWLSPAEITRAAAYRQPELRERFIARRGILRALLAQYLACQPASVAIEDGPSGKPRVARTVTAPDGNPPPEFSVSGSGAVAFYAISERYSTGVDVEGVASDLPHDLLAAHHFAPDECAALAACPEHERRSFFYALWVRKEACAKALGVGLSVPVDRYRVPFDAGLALSRRRVLVMGEPAIRLDVCDLEVEPDYRAALAIVR